MKVAINGAGRIGRAFIRMVYTDRDGSAQNNSEKIEIVAVNDLGDIENIAYLLKYDTAYGVAQFGVKVGDDKQSLLIQPTSAEAMARQVKFFSIKEPKELPWKDLGVDVVIESTGAFTSYEKAAAHIEAGAKRVLITAPAKSESGSWNQEVKGEMILMGINEGKLENCQISSNASCTTNSISPIIQILHEKIGVEKAILNTTHAYTASQLIVDGPNKKDWKEGRASAQNIIPTSTGAAKALTKVITDLEGKFDGISMRVPVIAGSIADVTFIAKRNTSVEEINKILKDAAAEERWQGIFTATEDPIVSSDIVGSLYGSITDLGLTRVVDGNLVKVCAWYDNEMGYTATLIKHVLKIGEYL